MKSMTDFIMEQEQSVVVEEAFNEAELVSSYMSVCASAANMACVYECASIVEFCAANDIAVPATLVQEGFSDFMSKVWKGISDFFAKIAEWFKGLVKGTTAVFAKAKLQETIAKLKTYDESTEVSSDKVKSLIYLNFMYGNILDVLEKFRDAVLTPITDESKTDENQKNDYIARAKDLLDDLTFLESSKNWKDANGEAIKNQSFKILTDFTVSDTGVFAGYNPSSTDPNANKITFGAVIKLLENINRLDIPTKAGKLLDAIGADEAKIKKLQTKEITINAGTSKSDADAAGLPMSIQSNGKLWNGDQLRDTYTGPSNQLEWVADKETQGTIKKCADSLAKVYDNIATATLDVTDKMFKDLKHAEGEEKAYKSNLEAANKKAGTDNFTGTSTIKVK